MIRRLTAALTVAMVAAGTIAVAAPASAYDADGYAYAAGHQISAGDIPTVLGTFQQNPQFTVFVSPGPVVLCQVPAVDASAVPATVQYPGAPFTYTALYGAKGAGAAPVVEVRVDRYRNERKAIRAFTLASKRIVACLGSGSSTYTDPLTGATTAHTTQVTHGFVPQLAENGVQALFVDTNSTAAPATPVPVGVRSVNDAYAISWLVGDAIITTTYYSDGAATLTKKQRKAVADVAQAAQRQWVE